jgi:pimeloyl-ACP methyl ester carboxylesterase
MRLLDNGLRLTCARARHERCTAVRRKHREHQVHFVHERGSGPAPRPLLIMHGWPYSFHTRLVDRLAHPEQFGGDVADAFNVVIPSFPGYGFSSCPSTPLGPRAIAGVFNRLMARTLGYYRYLAHGGDWGCYTDSLLGLDHRNAAWRSFPVVRGAGLAGR